jgi:hypothetical protein
VEDLTPRVFHFKLEFCPDGNPNLCLFDQKQMTLTIGLASQLRLSASAFLHNIHFKRHAYRPYLAVLEVHAAMVLGIMHQPSTLKMEKKACSSR